MSIEIKPPEGTPQDLVEASVKDLEERIAGLYPDVEVESIFEDDDIWLIVAGVDLEDDAIRALVSPREVTFRPVVDVASDVSPSATDDPETPSFLPSSSGQPDEVFHVAPAVIDNGHIASATANLVNGLWTVEVTFTSEGSQLFAELSGEAAVYPIGDVRRQIAVVVDGEVLSAPAVNPDVSPDTGITGGVIQIAVGSDDSAEAEALNLATALNFAVSVEFELIAVSRSG